MQEQTLSSKNNTQEQQNVITQKRKPGRPARNQSTTKPSDTIQIQSQLEAIHIQESEKDNTDSPDFKTLMSTINELKQQNEKLLHIVETVNITTTKPLITCSDEDINNLYVKYLTDKETTLNNVVVAEVDGRVLITKSYYVIG
jgi:hypothetical protein